MSAAALAQSSKLHWNATADAVLAALREASRHQPAAMAGTA
jgi:hypothetical protein